MTNAELIKALWCCACVGGCTSCPLNNQNDDCWVILTLAAADAFEADEQQIAELSLDNKMLKNTIDADKGVMLDRIRFLEAQLPKEGEWITDYDGFEYDVHCSVCGEEALIKEGGSHDHAYSRYCPNCGARIRKDAKQSKNDPIMKDIKDNYGLKPIITDGKNGLLHLE